MEDAEGEGSSAGCGYRACSKGHRLVGRAPMIATAKGEAARLCSLDLTVHAAAIIASITAHHSNHRQITLPSGLLRRRPIVWLPH